MSEKRGEGQVSLGAGRIAKLRRGSSQQIAYPLIALGDARHALGQETIEDLVGELKSILDVLKGKGGDADPDK